MDVPQIRVAQSQDLAEVIGLYAQPEIDDGVVLDLDTARAIFRRFESYPDYNLYVAVVRGRIVGSFALLIMDNLGHMGAPSGVVEAVVVAVDQQGCGVGTAMMQAAIAMCRQKRCYKLTLSANTGREKAHRFYESLGFRKHGFSFVVEPL